MYKSLDLLVQSQSIDYYSHIYTEAGLLKDIDYLMPEFKQVFEGALFRIFGYRYEHEWDPNIDRVTIANELISILHALNKHDPGSESALECFVKKAGENLQKEKDAQWKKKQEEWTKCKAITKAGKLCLRYANFPSLKKEFCRVHYRLREVQIRKWTI